MNNTVEFLEAVKEGNAPRVSALINNKPELVRVAGDHDKTGLHIAAELDHIDVARVLVDAGADIAAKTSWGASPLEWAAWGHAEAVKLLISRGADVTIKDARFDATAEGWAPEGGHTHIADILRGSQRSA